MTRVPVVAIHFAGGVTRIPLSQLARYTSTSLRDSLDSLAELEAEGWLTRRPDGDYDATMPAVNV